MCKFLTGKDCKIRRGVKEEEKGCGRNWFNSRQRERESKCSAIFKDKASLVFLHADSYMVKKGTTI